MLLFILGAFVGFMLAFLLDEYLDVRALDRANRRAAQEIAEARRVLAERD